MAISPIGTSTGGAAAAGFSAGGDTRTNLQTKLNTLKKQREEYELGRNSSNVTDKRALDNKIMSLDRRMKNLKDRIEKLDEKNNGECQTCKNRKYQDGSDDPGVSFKNATKISREAAASAVRGHEMEHVYRNRAKAAREGREVVSQSVTIKTGICPECGKPYVAGGETRTVTRAKNEPDFTAGLSGGDNGEYFDEVA